MNREEAIEVIEDIIVDVRRTTAEEEEALRMAIEALSATNLKEEFKSADAVMRDATAEERASVQRYIDSISTEAVQGEWVEVEDYNGDVHYKCDQCGEEWTFPFGTPKENNANFCPSCGSRMTPYKDGDPE